MKISIAYWRIWKPILELQFGMIKLSVTIQGLCLLVIPVAYIIMARRHSTVNALARTIIPHLVCIVWFDVAVSMWLIGYKHFNLPGLLLTAALLSLLIFPSYAGIILCIGILVSQLHYSVDMVCSFLNEKFIVYLI